MRFIQMIVISFYFLFLLSLICFTFAHLKTPYLSIIHNNNNIHYYIYYTIYIRLTADMCAFSDVGPIRSYFREEKKTWIMNSIYAFDIIPILCLTFTVFIPCEHYYNDHRCIPTYTLYFIHTLIHNAHILLAMCLLVVNRLRFILENPFD